MRLPSRPPRLVEVAAVIAVVASVAIGVGVYDRSHRTPVERGGPTAVLGTSSIQPIVSFHVKAGCATTPTEVLINGVHTDMPVNLFNPSPTLITVRTAQGSADAMVQADGPGRFHSLGAGAQVFAGTLYVAVGDLALC